MHTPRYSQDSHDAYNGRVDRQGSVQIDFLQCDSHDGQQDNGEVQLVPPRQENTHTFTLRIKIMLFSGYVCACVCVKAEDAGALGMAPNLSFKEASGMKNRSRMLSE